MWRKEPVPPLAFCRLLPHDACRFCSVITSGDRRLRLCRKRGGQKRGDNGGAVAAGIYPACLVRANYAAAPDPVARYNDYRTALLFRIHVSTPVLLPIAPFTIKLHRRTYPVPRACAYYTWLPSLPLNAFAATAGAPGICVATLTFERTSPSPACAPIRPRLPSPRCLRETLHLTLSPFAYHFKTSAGGIQRRHCTLTVCVFSSPTIAFLQRATLP